MIKKALFILMLPILFGQAALCCAGTQMRDGLWNLSVSTEAAEFPITMPLTQLQCLKGGGSIAELLKGGPECTVDNVVERSGVVMWTMRCAANGIVMEGRGNITLGESTFSGFLNWNVGGLADQGVPIKQRISGQRTGDCP